MTVFRKFLMAGTCLAVAACQPILPESGAGVGDPGRGVGFDDPSTLVAREARDAELSQDLRRSGGSRTQPGVSDGPRVGAPALPPVRNTTNVAATQPRSTARAVSDPGGLDAELAQIAAQNDASAARNNSGQGVVNASPSNAAPVLLNNPGISDENNFDAVASRESIESDAARIAANRQQYEVVQPTALPSRTGTAQPNVVQYALQTRHPKGTKVHRRFGSSAAKAQRNCATYNSADEAQIDFLARGGPERDRRGIDPDGDGYACAWDPAPFRRASGG
ncbi:hypothetical protein [uncultured Tateyamaria sp.]|uniref:hypothetical protein n=1 Tax=uncultured Tateyamaria sp. TaxID=455651 RepID=UPI00260B76F1|nr:hypothetical protein [uncultured Tateyamaria sp.]